jgi:hypothetical protein
MPRLSVCRPAALHLTAWALGRRSLPAEASGPGLRCRRLPAGWVLLLPAPAGQRSQPLRLQAGRRRRSRAHPHTDTPRREELGASGCPASGVHAARLGWQCPRPTLDPGTVGELQIYEQHTPPSNRLAQAVGGELQQQQHALRAGGAGTAPARPLIRTAALLCRAGSKPACPARTALL